MAKFLILREFELPEHLDYDTIQDMDDKGNWGQAWFPSSKHGEPVLLNRVEEGFHLIIGASETALRRKPRADDDSFDAPAPSLCDYCQHAGIMEGGVAAFGGKQFRQRYCNKLPHALHGMGLEECDSYASRSSSK